MSGHENRIKSAIEEADKERDEKSKDETSLETSTAEKSTEETKTEKSTTDNLTTEETEKKKNTTDTTASADKEKETEAKTEAKKEDKKEETTEEKTEEKKTEAKTEEKTEQPTLWWNATEEVKTETTPEVRTEIDKVKAYDDLLSDPEIKAFVDAKKVGKTLTSFLNEIKGVDVDKMSSEDIFRIELEKHGAKDEELKDALEDFRTKPEWEQNKEVAPLKESIKKEQADKLKEFSISSTLEVQKRDDMVKKGFDDLDLHLKNITGTKIDGFEITKEISDDIKNFVTNQFSIYNEDGSFNIDYLVDIALYKTHKKDIMKANFDDLEKEIEEKYIKKYSRPSKKETGTNSIEIISQADKSLEEAETYAKRFNPAYKLNNL